LHHLDDEYWGAGWSRPDPRRWDQRQRELADGGRWIIDGNYLPTIHLRATRADLAVLVDAATTRCLLRVLARAWRIRRGNHQDLPLRVRNPAATAPGATAPAGRARVRATRDLLPLLWMIIKFRARDWATVVDRVRTNPEVTVLVAVGRRRPRRRVAAVRDHLESRGVPSVVVPLPAVVTFLGRRPVALPGAQPRAAGTATP